MMSCLLILQLIVDDVKVGNSFVLLAQVKDWNRWRAGQAKELTAGRKATANLDNIVKQKTIYNNKTMAFQWQMCG